MTEFLTVLRRPRSVPLIVAGVSLASMLLSVGLTAVCLLASGLWDIRARALSIAAGVALVVTPICSVFFISSLRRIVLLKERVDILARTDELTNLSNRRCFFELAAERLAGGGVGGVALALLVIDLDHFKRINDTFGHSGGDVALQTAAGIIKSCVTGQRDLVGRLGGEEFIALIEEHSDGMGLIVAERIRSRIASAVVPTLNGDARMTASIGCAVATTGEDFGQLLHRADTAMYVAKANGRNRVEASRLERTMPYIKSGHATPAELTAA
jgi:diguanylate cyclase (GGDEF)-like protein